ncbi:hypothetical protein, partial [Escherichia coli]
TPCIRSLSCTPLGGLSINVFLVL